jgi:predicted nucleic acid-binding protein
LTAEEHANAHDNLAVLKRKWQEIEPSNPLRALAVELLDRYTLSAADALQLAAAYIWSSQRPFSRHFIAGDKRLLGAARSVGFRVIEID